MQGLYARAACKGGVQGRCARAAQARGCQCLDTQPELPVLPPCISSLQSGACSPSLISLSCPLFPTPLPQAYGPGCGGLVPLSFVLPQQLPEWRQWMKENPSPSTSSLASPPPSRGSRQGTTAAVAHTPDAQKGPAAAVEAGGPTKSRGEGPEGAVKTGDSSSGATEERMWMLKTPQHLGEWGRG